VYKALIVLRFQWKCIDCPCPAVRPQEGSNRLCKARRPQGEDTARKEEMARRG
jgi:hypothetical protein